MRDKHAHTHGGRERYRHTHRVVTFYQICIIMNCICTAICGKCGLLWSFSRSLSLSRHHSIFLLHSLSFSLSLFTPCTLTLQFVTVFMQMHERACTSMLHLYVCMCVCVCTFCELSRFGYTCWQRAPISSTSTSDVVSTTEPQNQKRRMKTLKSHATVLGCVRRERWERAA